MSGQFVKLDLIERTDATEGHVLTEIRLNGQSIHAPIDSKVVLTAKAEGLTEATVTFFVNEAHIVRLPLKGDTPLFDAMEAKA